MKLKILTISFAAALLTGCSDEEVMGAFDDLLGEVSEETATDRETIRTDAVAPLVDGEAQVSVLDVGQGDSALIQGEDTTILIDTGRHDSELIFDHLDGAGIEAIDLLVLTHPHADHIGNADEVINQYNPSTVWIDGNETTSQVFERLVDSLLESDADVLEPVAGESYEEGPFLLEVLNPNEELSGDLNNDSVSVRMTYGEVSFLLSGDAEEPAERLMVDSGMDLNSDVLVMGHHGSNTSSQDFFLEEVQPEVAIYSAGENNSYDHPGDLAIERVESIGAEVFGTIDNGTVTITTNGETFDVSTER